MLLLIWTRNGSGGSTRHISVESTLPTRNLLAFLPIGGVLRGVFTYIFLSSGEFGDIWGGVFGVWLQIEAWARFSTSPGTFLRHQVFPPSPPVRGTEEHRRTDGAQNGSIGPWELLHRPSQDQRPYIERCRDDSGRSFKQTTSPVVECESAAFEASKNGMKLGEDSEDPI